MKHTVCAITGSRAEYGLLYPLLSRLSNDSGIRLQLVVTGSHLDSTFGDTQCEIQGSGLTIHERIPIPLDGDSKASIAKAAGAALYSFADYFAGNRPELLILLGDRYEIFAAAAAASLQGIPIAHLYGGETTAGAVDEFLRHSITKMSLLHLTACERYRRRVIQLGEAPERVFAVGALGVENCLNTELMPLSELQESVGYPLVGKPFSVVTFHPVTLEDNTTEAQLHELICAIDAFPGMNYIITKANADPGGRAINRIWDAQSASRENWLLVSSLGRRRYLSALAYAEMVLGNSSSGIIEAPAMKTPTVNIGDRQSGRIMAESILCCEPAAKDIISVMKKALSPGFKAIVDTAVNPFGDGRTSQRIMDVIRAFLSGGPPAMKKAFYDIEVVL